MLTRQCTVRRCTWLRHHGRLPDRSICGKPLSVSVSVSVLIMASALSLNGASIVNHPPLKHPMVEDEVVVGTFHFGGTCVGLAHNYAGQRLDERSALHSCFWTVEDNSKGSDGQHAVAFLKPGSASLLRC